MYNRYIPQSDGTYLRSTVAERQQPPKQNTQSAPCPPPPVQERNARTNAPGYRPQNYYEGKRPGSRKQTGAADFLKNLLPKDLDTGDLLIILMLLLMSGDSPDEQNNALLTLALYLFL